VPGVVGRIAHQEHEPPAQRRRPLEAGVGERPADALPLPVRVDRERPEQERRPVLKPDRPVADRPHQPLALARDEAQGLHRRYAGPVAVGGLAVPTEAEGEVEQRLDRRPVERALRGDHEHRGVFRER